MNSDVVELFRAIGLPEVGRVWARDWRAGWKAYIAAVRHVNLTGEQSKAVARLHDECEACSG